MSDPSNLNELFYQAATLMLVGMAFVFAFLMLTIFAIQKVITPLGKKFADLPPTAQPATENSNADIPSPQVVAAISAAVKRYRSK